VSLPIAAGRFVKQHRASQLVQLDLRERNLGAKQIAVGVQHAQERVHSTAMPKYAGAREGLDVTASMWRAALAYLKLVGVRIAATAVQGQCEG
jgi:hypothetical protein